MYAVFFCRRRQLAYFVGFSDLRRTAGNTPDNICQIFRRYRLHRDRTRRALARLRYVRRIIGDIARIVNRLVIIDKRERIAVVIGLYARDEHRTCNALRFISVGQNIARVRLYRTCKRYRFFKLDLFCASVIPLYRTCQRRTIIISDALNNHVKIVRRIERYRLV